MDTAWRQFYGDHMVLVYNSILRSAANKSTLFEKSLSMVTVCCIGQHLMEFCHPFDLPGSLMSGTAKSVEVMTPCCSGPENGD